MLLCAARVAFICVSPYNVPLARFMSGFQAPKNLGPEYISHAKAQIGFSQEETK
jgi:delta 1-pyrroline-5-carboxylate dehydrogenase